jgi:hypothetical protein
MLFPFSLVWRGSQSLGLPSFSLRTHRASLSMWSSRASPSTLHLLPSCSSSLSVAASYFLTQFRLCLGLALPLISSDHDRASCIARCSSSDERFASDAPPFHFVARNQTPKLLTYDIVFRFDRVFYLLNLIFPTVIGCAYVHPTPMFYIGPPMVCMHWILS